MKMRLVLSLGLSALVMGGTMVGCTAGGGDLGTASSRSVRNAEKVAAKDAKMADKFLVAGNHAQAVQFAEAAVALRPQTAAYRAVLGEAYLKAGRFASASQSLSDAMTLGSADGHVALNLALAQIGEGKWHEARTTLDNHANVMSATDRGLALALAGDPATGVQVLMDVVRSPDATVKTRQNLALALALSGRWADSRVVAALDLAPADLDKRMVQWAAFAQPEAASDQVAALLGVVPVADPGQPVALALNAPTSVGVAAADAVVPARAAPAIEVAAVSPVPVPAATVQVAVANAPIATIAAEGAFKVAAPVRAKSMKVAAVAKAKPQPRELASGNFYVQLGAFDSAGVAKDAWGRAQRRFAAFRQQSPTGMAFAHQGANYYRLSVGGYTRADAVSVCRQYRKRGGSCFVRAGAGDAMAQWIRPGAGGVQMAAR
ncbi:conserved exported hypothetical protein [Sphingomonas sp. EC-HK361]|uniref:SPOR domain-containing protein n=1 Tax=Sphingomonas sp. EC-HK361 TaxID=2038397 RepID=UPI001253D80F|nr:SPOR domain-containing protein [Sphingomonas sp. EC-HK361]VVT11592.1 conserved exported hypothetical protein [Sphingomonas sp. EC-HK361]